MSKSLFKSNSHKFGFNDSEKLSLNLFQILTCNAFFKLFSKLQKGPIVIYCYKFYIISSSTLNKPLLFVLRKIFITLAMILIFFFRENFDIFLQYFFRLWFFPSSKRYSCFSVLFSENFLSFSFYSIYMPFLYIQRNYDEYFIVFLRLQKLTLSYELCK